MCSKRSWGLEADADPGDHRGIRGASAYQGAAGGGRPRQGEGSAENAEKGTFTPKNGDSKRRMMH